MTHPSLNFVTNNISYVRQNCNCSNDRNVTLNLYVMTVSGMLPAAPVAVFWEKCHTAFKLDGKIVAVIKAALGSDLGNGKLFRLLQQDLRLLQTQKV